MRIYLLPSLAILLILCCAVAANEQASSSLTSPVDNDNKSQAELSLFDATHTGTVTTTVPLPEAQDTVDEISKDSGKVTEILSSFEEVSPDKRVSDTVLEKDGLTIALNQGTVSQDLLEQESLKIVVLTDTATAELQQRALERSSNDEQQKTVPPNKTEPLSSIVISPVSETDTSKSVDKTVLPGQANENTVNDQTPTSVFRAEPKVITEPPSLLEEPESPTTTRTRVAPEEERKHATTREDASASEAASKSASASEAASKSAAASASIDLGVPVPSSESTQEDIPSFSEWTQKQLEEAEKKGQNKTAGENGHQPQTPGKIRSKNYASPDCGAKVVSTNPEAENPSGVLSSLKDEYLINKCSTQRMWVIIELCEAIQAKKLELANFELFSSSPRDFSVSLSHSYPSREWSSVGHFTARDERTIQSFNLHPHLFGKFVKVEFHTHYGREHFCCTSLIRVFGTSEFEVLETENEVHSPVVELDYDDDDELPIGTDTGRPAKNLFGHATNVVFSIVKKAAEVLGKGSESQNQTVSMEQENTTALIHSHPPRPVHCSTLRYLIVCKNCTRTFFHKVYHLLSCCSDNLEALLESPFILDNINNTQLCAPYGLSVLLGRNSGFPLRLKHEDQLDQAGYLAAMFPPEYIAALCNLLAVLEGRMILNQSHNGLVNSSLLLTGQSQEDLKDLDFKKLIIEPQVAQTCSVESSFSSSLCKTKHPETANDLGSSTSFPSSSPDLGDTLSVVSQIRPTRTFSKDDDGVSVVAAVDSKGTEKSGGEVKSDGVADSASTIPYSVLGSFGQNVEIPPSNSVLDSVASTTSISHDAPTADVPIPEEKEQDLREGIDIDGSDDQDHSKDLDALFQEMKALDQDYSSSETSSSTSKTTTQSTVSSQSTKIPAQQAQKESVFLRLSNKIKALERNMSLSGQYLEELSRRYKKQEELGRALNKTLVVLRDEVKRGREKEQQRESEIDALHAQVSKLLATLESLESDRNSWQRSFTNFSQHLLLITFEVAVFCIILQICWRLNADKKKIEVPTRKISGNAEKKMSRGHQPKLPRNEQTRRRSSLDALRNTYSPENSKRRCSSEKLKTSRSHEDLLRKEDNMVIVKGVDIGEESENDRAWLLVSKPKDHRRRRKKGYSNMVSSNQQVRELPTFKNFSTSRWTPEACDPQNLHSQVVAPGNGWPDGPATRRHPLFLNFIASEFPLEAEANVGATDMTNNGVLPSTMAPESAKTGHELCSSIAGSRTSSANSATFVQKQGDHDDDSGSNVSQPSSLTATHQTRNFGDAQNKEDLCKKRKKGSLKSMVKRFF